ncbi:MAG: FAD-dependent oxidoreductase [Gammaproteobacteria bacterium]|nr:FAD-dependent oxidoreductase [Gammaproteobacteria bacterium]
MKNKLGTQVAILGGGVCGLYAALVLAKQGVSVIVIERETVPGGLGAGHRFGENYYDFGVHMLYEHDAEILSDMCELMGDQCIDVISDGKIRWANGFFRYPLQFKDMVRGIPPLTLVRCVAGLFVQELLNRLSPKPSNNAEQALIHLYGKPLYEYFFKDFTERYWGLPPAQLSATFIKQKMPRLSAVDVFKNMLSRIGIKANKDQSVESALVKETLHYSRTGAETMPRMMMQRIRELGGTVLLNAEVQQVRLNSGLRKISILYHDTENKGPAEINSDYCISTIALPEFIKTITPRPPDSVTQAATALRYKAGVVHGLLVNRPKVLDSSYVYYRDRLFHRISEPKNAGMHINPSNHTVLIVEMTCEVGDEKWTNTDDIWRQLLGELNQEGLCNQDQVVEHHVIRNGHAYPIFDLGFETHLESCMTHLNDIPGLVSVGRQGGFCYPNMHGAMRMGADAADDILQQLSKGQSHADTEVIEETLPVFDAVAGR